MNNTNTKSKPVDIVMDSKVKTDVGIFRVKINHTTDIDSVTREIKKTGYSFGIGGNKDTCVFITIKDGSKGGSRRIKQKTRKYEKNIPNFYQYYDYLDDPASIKYIESDFLKN